jgi:hypothetical protein
MKSNFEKDPRRQPEKTELMTSAAFTGQTPVCVGSIVNALMEIKT